MKIVILVFFLSLSAHCFGQTIKHDTLYGCEGQTILFAGLNGGTLHIYDSDTASVPDFVGKEYTVHATPGIKTFFYTVVYKDSTSERRGVTFDIRSKPNAEFSYTGNDLTYNFLPTDQNTMHKWDFGDGKSTMDTFPVHTYSTPGTYLVEHFSTDTVGCNDYYSLQITVGTTSLLEKSLSSGFKVFPNPAHEVLNIQGMAENLQSVKMYDIYGKTVIETFPLTIANMQIKLSDYGLVPGIYFVSLHFASKTTVVPIVIN